METIRAVVHVHGHIQGVGFRAWARARMRRLGVTGAAENRPDGSVDLRVEGPAQDVERFVEMIRPDAPGRVEQVVVAVEDLSEDAGPDHARS